ncbi:hypothetical protein [Saccharopolyspora tripterygii]
MTDRQWERRRADQARIETVADALRKASRQQQADSIAGHAPVIPTERWIVLRHLDALGLAAGRGELTDSVRRSALELCEAISRELDGETR